MPELVPHDVYATGDTPLRVLGFFAAAMVESVFDETMEPMGRRVLGRRRSRRSPSGGRGASIEIRRREA